MSASTREELVDEIVNATLVFYRDRFPVMHGVDVQAIAIACGHPYKENMQGGVNHPADDDAFGESFNALVRSCQGWLANEGWLIGTQGTSGGIYTLSERGARLAQCLPNALRSE